MLAPVRHGVRPFYIKRFLDFPCASGIGSRQVGAAVLPEFYEAGRIGQAELLVEVRQVAGIEIGARAVHEVGVVIGVDDGNRLSGSITRDRAEADLVDPIGRANLLGCESVLATRGWADDLSSPELEPV